MRMVLILLLIISLSSPALAYNWCGDLTAEGCWDFSDGSDTTLTDKSSNGYNGTISGATWGAISGTGYPIYADYMLSFDGSNDYADLTSNFSPGTSDFSVSIWVNSADVNSFAISSRSGSTADGYEILIGGGSASGTWNARVDGAINVTGTTKTGLQSAWHYVVFGVKDTKVFWYSDGVVVQGTSGASPGSITNTQNLYIGRRGTTYFTGDITETAFFLSALSETDINDIMENGLASSGYRIPTTLELRNVTVW